MWLVWVGIRRILHDSIATFRMCRFLSRSIIPRDLLLSSFLPSFLPSISSSSCSCSFAAVIVRRLRMSVHCAVCAPWILFLYKTIREKMWVMYCFFLLSKHRAFRHEQKEERKKEKRRREPVNKVREEATWLPFSGGAHDRPCRLRPISLPVDCRHVPPTPSSIDVKYRWSLHEYILWLRRFTNKLNICFN